DGTFEVTLPINASWSVGSTHIIDVYDQSAKLMASKSFTIVSDPSPGLTYCNPGATHAQVSLGPISTGSIQSTSTQFTLCSQGNKAVSWVGGWDQKQAPWLQLQQNGLIPAGTTQSQQLDINASAANLKPGTYKTSIVFSSSLSDVKVVLDVSFTVVAANSC